MHLPFHNVTGVRQKLRPIQYPNFCSSMPSNVMITEIKEFHEYFLVVFQEEQKSC